MVGASAEEAYILLAGRSSPHRSRKFIVEVHTERTARLRGRRKGRIKARF